jgi:hypothetical protein
MEATQFAMNSCSHIAILICVKAVCINVKPVHSAKQPFVELSAKLFFKLHSYLQHSTKKYCLLKLMKTYKSTFYKAQTGSSDTVSGV